MKILADLLSSLHGNDFPVKSVHTCVFWTAVVSKHCGLSSTFRDEGPPHDRGVREIGNLILPQCEVVGITGTSFINHTLEGLLSLCKGAYVVLIGPTSPLSPILFDYGINAICGSKIIDPDQLIRSISEGATFKEVKGVINGLKIVYT